MIDRQTIDKIMDAADIVDVISEFVNLRRSGSSYKGLCPFHDDHTPSFFVSPSRGIYKCFTCGKAGNVVRFVMDYEQLSYPDALRWLARRYHIEIKERELSTEEKREESERESMLIVNEWAAKWFANILDRDVDGRAIGMQYFRSRGFRDDIIKKFNLGFAPSGRDTMTRAALKAGYKEEFLVGTGLTVRRDDGTLYDRFSGRAMFPWFSVGGKVVAFGGRVLDSRTKGVAQKYVNSPDSPVYHKERELYGLFQAKRAIAKEDSVYMVEGYTDVISMHQAGIENVVANSGTALSVYQIRLLHRFTNNIVLLYDGDEAGIHAALRGTDMLLSEGMNVKVLLLPDGNDPDSFARSHTAADFRQYVNDHQTDFIVFLIDVKLRGVTDPIKRATAVNDIVRSISVIHDPIVRSTYIHECSVRTGVAENTLISQMNRLIYNTREREERRQQTVAAQQPRVTAVPTPTDAREQVERMLAQLIVRYGERTLTMTTPDNQKVSLMVAEYIYVDLAQDKIGFVNPTYQRMLDETLSHCHDAGFHAADYLSHLDDPDVSQTAIALSIDPVKLTASLEEQPNDDTLRDRTIHLLLDLRMTIVERQLSQLKGQLRQIKPGESIMDLMSQIKETQERRNLLAKRLGSIIV